jgi:hypothetical protein
MFKLSSHWPKVNQECFDKMVFGDRLEDYKQFVKYNLNKIGQL